MRKILRWVAVAYLAVLIGSQVLVGLPVKADSGSSLITNTETLPFGVTRISQYATVKNTGMTTVNGMPTVTYTETISPLPQTMPDLKTEITCQWIQSPNGDGTYRYQTGNNTIWASVNGDLTTVQVNGQAEEWNPSVWIGSKLISETSGPTVVNDPFNPNYSLNCIKWTYTVKSGGFLSQAVTIDRYIRQIEGQIQELYVISSDPGGDLSIMNNTTKESGFTAGTALYGMDKNWRPITVTEVNDTEFISQSEFQRTDRQYPYLMDPTVTFSATTADAEMQYSGTNAQSYQTVWAQTTAQTVYSDQAVSWVEQAYASSVNRYAIHRGTLYFMTSSLPTNATITGVQLQLYINSISGTGSGINLQLQSGGSTYPHDPAVAGDFYQAQYSGTSFAPSGAGGSSLDTMTANSYNTFNFIPAAFSWVTLGGESKFILRTSQDISQTAPANGDNGVSYSDVGIGSGYLPQLIVSYSIPSSSPVINTNTATGVNTTSANLNGTLTSDGNASCSLRFQYGTTGSYGSVTPWQQETSNGQTFSANIQGLVPGTLYHYTAQAQNSTGYSNTVDGTFLTQPLAPTSFTCTPGAAQNALAWTLGTGSTNTIVVMSTVRIPTSITDGSQIYTSTGTSYTNTSLTNGTPYYYAAFSETINGGLTQYGASSSATGTPTAALGPPAVSSNAAAPVGTTTATFNGTLVSLGGYASANVSFQYYWGAGAFTDHQTTPVGQSTLGQITPVPVTGLPATTLVHQRAVAVGTGGTVYGSDITFTTGAASAPTLVTNAATGITQTSATIYGTVSSDGGAPPVTAQFSWGLTTSYGNVSGQGTNLQQSTSPNLQYTLTGLTPGTTYHFQAWGNNSTGTSYGADASFTTVGVGAAVVSTSPVTNVGSTTVTLNGTLTADGGVPCSVYFEWGTTSSYGTNVPTSPMTGYSAGSSFTILLTGLSPSTTYYYNTVAVNAGGTVYGTGSTFTTVFIPPVQFQSAATSTSTISLSWVPQGDQTLIMYQVGSYPPNRHPSTTNQQAYLGTGSSTIISGLTPGTTYFFCAWSLQGVSTYTTTYSTDSATTLAGGVTTTAANNPLDKVRTPPAPSWMFSGGNDTAIQAWPGVGIVDSVATSTGWGLQSCWAIAVLFTCIIVGGGAGIITAVSGGATASGFVVLIVCCVILGLASVIGLIPGIALVFVIIIGIGGIYVLTQV